MALKRIFKKPNWQHHDPVTRAQAVAVDQDPALEAALLSIALEDENESVRLAALLRLDDFSLDLRLAREDPSAAITTACWKRVRHKLAGQSTDKDLGMDQRKKLLAQLNDAESLRYVAGNGVEAPLRELAALQLDEPAVWLGMAQSDLDSRLRLHAARQLHDSALLKRLARDSRRSDKAVYRLAQTRLQALADGQADPKTAQARAEDLCRCMEALVTNPQRARAVDYHAIDTQWQALPSVLPDPLQQRYARAARVVGLATGVIEHPPATALPEPTKLKPDDKADNIDDTPDPRLLKLLDAVQNLSTATGKEAACRKMEARINTMHGRCDVNRDANRSLLDQIEHGFKQATHRRDLEQHTRQQQIQQLESLAGEIELALEARQLLAAVKLMNRAHGSRKSLGKLPDTLQQRFSLITRSLAELRSWQRWADNEARRALCEQAEHLIEDRPHPDALVTLVRKLKQQWQEMDQREAATEASGRPGGGRWRGRFFHAINAIMRPARPYFERREQLREQHSDNLQALCEQLDQAASGALKLDWKSTEQLLRRGHAGLRELAKVHPKERKRIAARIKAATAALNQRLAEHHESVARLKTKLLQKAKQIGAMEDPARAARQAKTLMQEWKSVGQAGRQQDQALWSEFRPLLDAAYQRADAERSAAHQIRNAALETLGDLCKQIESLVASARKSGQPLDEATLHRCQGQWTAVESELTPALKQRYSAAVEKAELLVQEQRLATRKTELQSLFAHSTALAKQETDVLDGKTHELSVETRQTLQQQAEFARRLTLLEQGAEAMQGATGKNAETAQTLVLQLEIAADLPSPKHCHAARMTIKVNALARQIEERSSAANPLDQAEQLIRQWCRLGPLESGLQQALARRVSAATKRLLQ